MDRFLCIHGHFYQPPRENPWLEEIEVEDSAYPYHDWNERVAAECYAPNTASRVLDEQQKIQEIVNNYAKISFNFGPTLLSWMERHAREVYDLIIEADRVSRERRSGHGNAIAQVYNHIIMPLARRRDKETEIIWGIRDFERRFGRRPEGMWLAETAVDSETLELLAENGIRFTILAPHQARRIRKIGEKDWTDVSGGRIDPSRAYAFISRSGRTISLFFYDGPVSRAIAFEGLLSNGDALVGRLLGGFSDSRSWPQLMHVATDGESYGHHHRYGDMALAYALSKIEKEKLATLTNYGEFLEKYPPEYQVEIQENSSWSCFHGVERWRSDCGCNTGMRRDWNQRWRRPLRESLNWLRDAIDQLFESRGREYFKDPWQARNLYIDVILDRSREKQLEFFAQAQSRQLVYHERIEALKLLEMQRHSLLMFTSCGWFFDELSGIETVQILKYAARALQIAAEFGADLERDFVKRLGRAKSNIPEQRDGALIWEKLVKPSQVSLRKVIAHHAISSLFQEPVEIKDYYCFRLQQYEYQRESYGAATLAIGRVKVISEITMEMEEASFGVLHLGSHDFRCSIRRFLDHADYQEARQEIFRRFRQHSMTEVIRGLDTFFGTQYYAIKELFLEERRRILAMVTSEALSRFAGLYRQLYNQSRGLMEYLIEVNAPIPKAFHVAAEYILSEDLARAFENMDDENALREIDRIMAEAKKWGIELSMADIERKMASELERQMRRLGEKVASGGDWRAEADSINRTLDLAEMVQLKVDIWNAQNFFFKLAHRYMPGLRRSAEQDGAEARENLNLLLRIAERLNISRAVLDGQVG